MRASGHNANTLSEWEKTRIIRSSMHLKVINLANGKVEKGKEKKRKGREKENEKTFRKMKMKIFLSIN